MKRKSSVRRRRKNRSRGAFPPFARMMLLFVFLGLASFIVAWTWQNMESEGMGWTGSLAEAPDPPEGEAADPPGPEEEDAPEPLPEIRGEEPTEENPEEDEEEMPYPENRPVFQYAVPKSEKVDNSYFDDAIFLGDSISVGIPLYKTMPNADVVAAQGITSVSVNTKAVFENEDGEMVTMLEKAKEYGEKSKVYVMLGGNGLGYDIETFTEGYRTFVRSVRAQYPGAVIYLQSITPVTETDEMLERYPHSTNERIDEHNVAIEALAREQGVFFLDVASALMDEDGKLPEEASPLDGVHFTPEYYAKWFEYLKTHTMGVAGR